MTIMLLVLEPLMMNKICVVQIWTRKKKPNKNGYLDIGIVYKNSNKLMSGKWKLRKDMRLEMLLLSKSELMLCGYCPRIRESLINNKKRKNN